MKNNIVTFISEKYSKPPKKYPTNKIVYNHFDEIWSIDLADFQIIKHLIIKVRDMYSSK